MFRNLAIGLACSALGLMIHAPSAHAQAWPTKPVTIIVPAGAGGVTDLLARTIAPLLSKRLGQTVVVDNKPGANGVLGVSAAAKSRADGYTFVIGTSTSMAANVHLYKNFPVDPIRDFAPLALIGEIPFALAVPADSRFKTMKDLIAEARRSPGKINYGSGTSSAVLCAELVMRETKIELTRVPYKTGPAALTDLMAGRVDVVCESITSMLADARGARRLRSLALVMDQRTPLAPDVETVSEAGFGKVHYAAWLGFWAPAATPKDVLARLSSELVAVIKDPEMQSRLPSFGVNVPASPGPETLAEAQREEVQKIGVLVKAAKIEAE
ncbi:Bug family tripartite tricarboxylate transporter substrate binding protein [Ramlibacter sp.]|uniref:Bug family tripartite tricarboxylate transporter substrate binding protein n=1 Tax=Ramlibacter sp. TaxID=1917967 RepID=UPI003D0BF68C